MTDWDDAFDRAIMEAHSQGDVEKLIDVYHRVAQAYEQQGEIERACFFWSNAFVFALEAGSVRVAELNAKLVRHGRELPL